MPTLTVFTPTYNRAYCLHKCYESLLRQTCRDFAWLVVDDGSTDQTRQLVDGWIAENRIPIQYVYKENGGMHTGYDLAYDRIETELAVCIDSDDFMTDDAVEKIVTHWRADRAEGIAGMIFLDITEDGKVLGSHLPNVRTAKVYDLRNRMHVWGDKKEVYRPELMRKFHCPVFEGEKLFPPCCKSFEVDLTHDVLVYDEPICVVKYMPDGFTKNIIKMYKQNLNSFIYYRKYILSYPTATFYHKFRFAIHYVAESLLNRDGQFIRHSPKKLMTVCAVPFGLLLYLYLYFKG